MIRPASVKTILRKVPLVENFLNRFGRWRLDRQHFQSVVRFSKGSLNTIRHRERLQATWQPRRRLQEIAKARIVLVCMETWEVRSLIPRILNHFDAVHIPICDTTEYSIYSAQQQRIVEEFLRAENAHPVDLVIVYATNAQVSAETLWKMREHGPLIAVMCLDDKQSFQDHRPTRAWPAGQLPLIGSAHIHLSSSRECLRWYDCHSASALYWPEGANPDFGYYPDHEKNLDVSFVGQAYGARMKFVRYLRRQGLQVSCFGNGWENPYVTDEEMFQIFARSKINLGFGYVGYSNNITCLKGRDFDVPGSENFYLTTYDAELADCFKIGQEIACYRDEMECAELIRYYLEQRDLRERIAVEGHKRVLKEHLWEHRLQSLVDSVGMLD